MADVLVYSAVFGKYDMVREPLEPGRYLLITDGRAPWGWEEQHERPTATPARTARFWKTKGMPKAEYTIWLDGNVQLVLDPQVVVQMWLIDTRADIALFRHPVRDCIYQEAAVVKSKNKDFPETVDAQMKRYREWGFPAHFGLAETPIIARRNSPAVGWFNDKWWNEISSGSLRDQLSFDYVRWLMSDKIKVHFVDGGHRWRRREHEWLKCWPHDRRVR